MNKPKSPVVENPWGQLRRFTAARIALGRTGVSLPTDPQLAFQLAHARARDAVHLALDARQLVRAFESAGLPGVANGLILDSAAGDRLTYLQRPDLGRRLNAASRATLAALPQRAARRYDVAFVVADGLSALAIMQNAAPFLAALMPRIAPENWTLAPIAIVRQGRVAVADEVAELLGAKLVVILIGERPGLSSPDSMGLYLTWMPQVGTTDAGRNCISNVRPAGLSYEEAAFKSHYLMSEARKRQLSGVHLKDETDGSAAGPARRDAPQKNFLLPGDDAL
jgi:ethanolamine ammonia-lyase small subunit